MGVALVDVVAGLYATVGILAALRARERTGSGQRVDVNLLSSVLAALVNQSSALRRRRRDARVGWAMPTRASRRTRPCARADGPLAVAAGQRLASSPRCAQRSGTRAWPTDPRFATNPGARGQPCGAERRAGGQRWRRPARTHWVACARGCGRAVRARERHRRGLRSRREPGPRAVCASRAATCPPWPTRSGSPRRRRPTIAARRARRARRRDPAWLAVRRRESPGAILAGALQTVSCKKSCKAQDFGLIQRRRTPSRSGPTGANGGTMRPPGRGGESSGAGDGSSGVAHMARARQLTS